MKNIKKIMILGFTTCVIFTFGCSSTEESDDIEFEKNIAIEAKNVKVSLSKEEMEEFGFYWLQEEPITEKQKTEQMPSANGEKASR